MKRSIMCVVSLIVTVAILISANIMTADATSSFYSQATSLQIKKNIEKDAKLKYTTAQGACTDGKYAYIALNNGSTTILKYDAYSYKLVKKRGGLSLNHANDMAYNRLTDTIVVCNNSPNYDTISFLDPDTLTVTGTKKIKHKIYSIAYNEYRNCYVVGLSGGYDFAILDSDFKLIKKHKGYKSGYLRQGADCDDNFLYFAQSGSGGNLIVIYDWNGNFVDTVRLQKSLEMENIYHIGNTFFTTLHYYGNYVYRIGINSKSAIKYTIKFESGGAKGKMKNMTVTYGKPKNMPKCTYKKDGYSFLGWIMKQNEANLYYGRKTPYSKPQWLPKKQVYEYVLFKDQSKVAKTAKVGNVTATAFFACNEYTIHYDLNGGVGHINSTTVRYDQNYLMPQNTLTREGYVFLGFYAQRDFDNKILGYKKGQSTPKWLLKKDLHKPHYFTERTFVSKLTYDKDVTMRAQWQLAFEFSKSGNELTKYTGYDKNVRIPNKNNSLTTIGEKAFYNSLYMESLTIPETVTTIKPDAFKHCINLNTIYFENKLPTTYYPTSFVGSNIKICMLKKDNKEYLLGTFCDNISYSHMLVNYNKFFA